jgi:hypothetical protein
VKACAYGIVFLYDEHAWHRRRLILCSNPIRTLLFLRGPAMLGHVDLFRFVCHDSSSSRLMGAHLSASKKDSPDQGWLCNDCIGSCVQYYGAWRAFFMAELSQIR